MHVVNRITPLALALVCSAGFAQETTATLVGNVRTKKNDVVANATIRLTSPALLGERTIKADAKGGYRIPLLPTGTYTATFIAPGYLTNKSTFTLMAGQVIRQDSVMKAESEIEVANAVVEVVASVIPAQVDKTQTVTQTSMTVETMQTLGQSSIHTALLYAPGVTQGSGNNASPDFSSIRGGMGVGTATLLNGGSTKSQVKNLSEFPPTIMDMVESMSVIQSPMNAKYGNTSGGVISWATSRGSNEFSGVIRRKINRLSWNSAPGGAGYLYGDRLGRANATQALNDLEANDGIWQLTLKGPIIKDKLTFAYATQLYPDKNSLSRWVNTTYDKPEDQIWNRQATFYRDSATGQAFRQSHLSPFDGRLMPGFTAQTWNQMTLFYQINDSHSLEYGQTTASKTGTRNEPGENLTWYSYGDTQMQNRKDERRLWNAAYRGIFGSGVLEARTGGKIEEYKKGMSPTPGVATFVYSNNINTPQGPRLAENMLEARHGRNAPAGFVNFNTLWSNGDGSANYDALKTWHSNVNYQHFLEAAGMHVLDVGVEHMKTTYEDKNVLPLWVQGPGRLNQGLAAAYAGKFIVVPYDATVGDVTGGKDYDFTQASGNRLRAAASDALLTASFGGSPFIPTMFQRTGAESGNFHAENSAIYLNDNWTINDRHSLMAGLRVDRYKVKDDVKDIHSFTSFSPRFEYKFDLAGDQRRIVNVSWGRFTDTLHSWYFKPYAQSYLGNSLTRMWTGKNPDGTKRPYLVDYADMINPANFGYIVDADTKGGAANKLNPNVRAPQSEEITVGFRRSFENGSFYRATLVHKFWRHLFNQVQAGAATVALPDGDSKTVLSRILQEDTSLKRAYNSLELEWNFVFTKRVQLGGNYTYSRMTTNDTTQAVENPMGIEGNPLLWRAFNNSYVPNSEWEANALVAGGHVMKAWLVNDLSVGKLKQSLVLRGSYSQGAPFSNTATYNVDTVVVPGVPSDNPALAKTVTGYIGGAGQFRSNDSWNMTLSYNLQVPVFRKVAWFCNIEVSNFLNSIQRAGFAATGGASQDWYLSKGQTTRPVFANSVQGSADNRADESRFGWRSVVLETGIRF